MAGIPDRDYDEALGDLFALVKDVVSFLGPVEFDGTGVTALPSDDHAGFVLKGIPPVATEATWLRDHVNVVALTCTRVLSTLAIQPVAPVVLLPSPKPHGASVRLGRYVLPPMPSRSDGGLN